MTSRSDALAYISGDKIECLKCGKKFQVLGRHLKKIHGMTPAEYRDRFNIPSETPLAGAAYRQFHRDKMSRMISEGVVTHWHLSDAIKKAASSGRGERRDFDINEQKERMRENSHYKERTLPQGSKRADGRDADKLREYQRACRAMKKGDNSLMIKFREKYPKGESW
ncbi:TPA: MucR family transcriptional regulator [Klebsiella michiganensis]|nr:MucR family transcriptional regulator [Klebsiella michiganensis]